MKTRLKHLSKGIGQYGANIAATEYVEDGCRFLRTTDITEDGDLKQDGDGVFIAQEAARGYLLGEGDLLFSRSGTIGRSYLHQGGEGEQFAFAGYLVRFTPGTDADPRFLFHASRSAPFQGQISADSIQTTISNFNAEKYGNLELWLPPLPTQRAIAAFLDRKTAAIDDLIDKKERLIKLLAEKRAALIHRAVTKGLDDGVEMKDSGIPWIGEIPAHWVLTAVKRACSSVRDGTHGPPPRFPAGEHRLLSARNIQNGRFILRDDDRRMTPEAFAELERSYTVRDGDVVLASVGATTGKSAVVGPVDNVSVQRSLAILRPNRHRISSNYLHTWLDASVTQHAIQLTASQYAAQGGIYLEDVANLPLVLPSKPEQAQILRATAPRLSRMRRMAGNLSDSCIRLQEYRQALITAAVTGQLDIGEEAA